MKNSEQKPYGNHLIPLHSRNSLSGNHHIDSVMRIRIVPMALAMLIIIHSAGCLQAESENQEHSPSDEHTYEITISAGAFDRTGTIVSFPLPDEATPGHYSMQSDQGAAISVQVDENNTGWVVLEALPAGTTETFRLNTGADRQSQIGTAVTKETDHNTITFQENGRPVLSYFHQNNEPPEELDERYRRSGYIHPVYSPGGVILTTHLNVDGHPHHSGIWSAWTNTEFDGRTPDFWNVHQNTGRVDADTMYQTWSGPVHAGFRSRHTFTDLSADEPVTALNEAWDVRVYRTPESPEIHLFDLTITQTVNSGKPLLLPEYRYGGVGFRGHKDWDDPENSFFLTSDGLGRDGHGTRARWSHIGGHSDGELAGIAILGHPANYRAPQTMRIHPDEPFFNFAPTQLGNMAIEPGSPYITKYRYVTYDGDPDAGLIDQLWYDFAYPPGVTVRRAGD